MVLTTIAVEGLRGTDRQEIRAPGREGRLPSGPVGVAILDALELFAASCVPERVEPTLRALHIAGDGDVDLLVEGGLPIQVAWTGGDAAALVGDSRTLTVHVEIALDPPLFGRLREEALRDPRLVNGFANGHPTLGVRVGWMFTKDLSTASIAILRVTVGDVAFQVAGAERPRWLQGLLNDIGCRLHRVRWDESEVDLTERMLAASLSADPEVRGRYMSCCASLGAAPFDVGTLELVRVNGRVQACFGANLLRLRQAGPSALEALRLVEAVELVQPDVLLVESPGALQSQPEAVWRWLVARVKGDDAIVEQVLAVRAGDA